MGSKQEMSPRLPRAVRPKQPLCAPSPRWDRRLPSLVLLLEHRQMHVTQGNCVPGLEAIAFSQLWHV